MLYHYIQHICGDTLENIYLHPSRYTIIVGCVHQIVDIHRGRV